MNEPLMREIQRRLEQLGAQETRLAQRVAALEQSAQKQWGLMPPQSGGSGGGGVMFAVTPSSGSWPGGAPPGGTPGHFTTDVYQIAGGAYDLVASGATVYNGYPSSPGVSKVVTVEANDDGTYSVVGESCA